VWPYSFVFTNSTSGPHVSTQSKSSHINLNLFTRQAGFGVKIARILDQRRMDQSQYVGQCQPAVWQGAKKSSSLTPYCTSCEIQFPKNGTTSKVRSQITFALSLTKTSGFWSESNINKISAANGLIQKSDHYNLVFPLGMCCKYCRGDAVPGVNAV
jgi:hypothetical protein